MSRTNNYEISKENARRLFLAWDQERMPGRGSARQR